MAQRPAVTEKQITKLLQLAGAPTTARAWLVEALVAAQGSSRPRPHPADHNGLLADVAATARRLAKQLDRLRRQPHSWYLFRSSVEPSTPDPFSRRAVAEDDLKWSLRQPVPRTRVQAEEFLSILGEVERAAQAAK